MTDVDARFRESLEGLEQATETMIEASRLARRPIVVSLPKECADWPEVQVLIRPGVEPEVDIRPHPHASWRPIDHEGGSFEVRAL